MVSDAVVMFVSPVTLTVPAAVADIPDASNPGRSDHEVVEFAATVPAEMKIASGGKHILKEAARRIIPAEVIDRPKGYFPVPALKYLRGQFYEMAKDAVTNSMATRRNLFQSKMVKSLLQSPEEHITPLRGSKLWQIALLELWLQEHVPEGGGTL